MNDLEYKTGEPTPGFFTVTIHRKDGPPIVHQVPDDDKALYWEPFCNLREWLRDECERLNTRPFLASLNSPPTLSWIWNTTEFSLTFHDKNRKHTVQLLYSHEHHGFCYGIDGDHEPPLEQYVALKDGFGVFVSPDGQVLTLEGVGRRVLGLLFMAADTNSARTGTLPVC